MVPRGVVAHILPEEGLDRGELGGRVEEVEVADEPLPVGPDVVVFGVEEQDAREEEGFGCGGVGERGEERLAVVPGWL
jgi:hypothetical protein